ncbi:MAG: phosphotransferase [Candidatus Acidiferrales bacterium]
MNTLDQSEPKTFRLIIVRRSGSEVFFRSSDAGWTLPCVQASPRERLALQLTTELTKQSGPEGYCLFIPHLAGSDKSTCRRNYAVMESLAQNDQAPRGTCWMSGPALACWCTHSPEDADAIVQSLAELDSYVREAKAGPFGKPGWLRELFAWTQEQLNPLGLHVSGSFRQLNASPTFSLIRLETNGPAVWFKATGAPNLHEFPITLALSRLFPASLPTILGVRQAWNAWLSEEFSNTTLEQCEAVSIWEIVAKDLAELQIASIGKSRALLDAPCRDLRLPGLIGLISPFLARMAEFMETQRKQSPPPLTVRELDYLEERLEEAFSALRDLCIPDTLGHLDLNPGNILVSPVRSVFLDWAEACITNPFITFEYLAEHTRQRNTFGAKECERVAASYRRPWQSFLSPEDLTRAMEVSPLIAVFTYASAVTAWRSDDTLHNDTDAGFLRGLTRRMYREAIRLPERSARCSG